PSEVMVLADAAASAELCAAELLAQAEHDPLASAILVTTSETLADEVERTIAARLPGMERQSIIRQSLKSQGKIIVAPQDEAIELANLYAPEHVLLLVEDPGGWVENIRHAGAIFVNTPVSLGDYILGPSHVLPTGGSARFASPLSIEDFLKITTLVTPHVPGLKKLAGTAEIIARAEGLDAHARSMKLAWEKLPKGKRR
ncbi:MAG: histidinol dehydrogenase, partial [Chloroflexota bacterium]